MREIIEELKHGFKIALSELLFFVVRIGCCLFYVGIPFALATVIPALVMYLLILCEVKYASLIFKILFSLFQILALPMSMSMVDSEEQVSETDPGKPFIPSKDLIIAIYVMLYMYVWGFI